MSGNAIARGLNQMIKGGSFCLVAILISGAALAAPDIQAGAQLAETLCLACHGPKGISTNPIWPSLYGQSEQYLLKSMRDYKTGARKDPLMTPQSQLLSERDMENVAAYYGQFRLEDNQQ